MSERGEVVGYATWEGKIVPSVAGEPLVRQSDYLAVRDELEGWHAQHARDSAELRRLCAERDSLKAELATLKARIGE